MGAYRFPVNRREFLRIGSKAAAATLLGGGLYSLFEAKWIRVTRVNAAVPRLATVFDGMTIAFLADFHHSEAVPADYIARVVAKTNALSADLIILGGDYVTAGRRYGLMGTGSQYLEPCFAELRKLKANLGIFAVTGNHDSRAGLRETRRLMNSAGFENLTNRGVWLNRNGERLRLCGIGDFTTQRQDLHSALADTRDGDACILVTHNPDCLEHMDDPRVGLALCGHTHGGQVAFPFIGSPIVPSVYGNKYRYGLVRGPHVAGYVTSGVGTLPLAIRLNCRPEIALLTLC